MEIEEASMPKTRVMALMFVVKNSASSKGIDKERALSPL